MSRRDDGRLEEAKAIPIEEIAGRLGIEGLRKTGGEMVGPCPICGGTDRFGINVHSGLWLCRRCDGRGDGLALVQFALGCDFSSALAWLVGERAAPIDPAELERRRAKARAAEAERDRDAERYRDAAIRAAKKIWGECVPAEGTLVRDYLARRGITRAAFPDLPPTMRFHGDLPYWRKLGDVGREWHRGPAMVCAMLQPDNRVTAVHMTWLDLDQPKGKAVIPGAGPEDKPQPAKLMRGSKKGTAIRLTTAEGRDTLVMGEGIETTLTALALDRYPGAAYWAGGDLGNMAGKTFGKKRDAIPDPTDSRAFVPPPWIRRLILILDGDSSPAATRAALLTCANRAMRKIPGLKAQIVNPGDGLDLNDLLLRPDAEEGADV